MNSTEGLQQMLVGQCWVCATVRQVIVVALGFGDRAFTSVAGVVEGIYGVLMGLWILLFAARLFMPFGPEGSPGELWNGAAKKVFTMAFVLAFLQSSEPFWHYVFVPVMGSGIGLSGQLLSLGQAADCPAPAPAASGLAEAEAMMAGLDCPLAATQNVFAKGILIGAAMMVSGAPPGGLLSGWSHFVPLQFIGGALLFFIYGLGLFLFPLTLVEVVVKSLIITVIAPILIAAFSFDLTRRAAGKGVRHLVQAALSLVLVSVVVSLGMAVVDFAIGQAGARDWQGLIGNLENYQTSLTLLDANYWLLFSAPLFVIVMIFRVRDMANDFADAHATTGALSAVAGPLGAAGWLGGDAAQVAMRGGGRMGSGAAWSAGWTGAAAVHGARVLARRVSGRHPDPRA